MCTVGHAAVISVMYPPDGICQYLFYTDVVIVEGSILASREQNSWRLFQMKARVYKKVKSGIAFDHRTTTSRLLTDAKKELATLASNNIDNYGLLNVIRKPGHLRSVVRAMKPVVDKLKNMQGSDPDKRTVIAIGSYDYSKPDFMDKYKEIIVDVVNTFKADAVIAISSVGLMEDDSTCYAAPPTVLISPMTRFPSLETHWPLVRANATYDKGEVLVGVSFEMAAMIYVLMHDAPNLNSSAYAKCKGFGLTSRDAICGPRKTVDQKVQLLKNPYVVYASFVNDKTSKHVIFAEYFTSARDKFTAARRKFGSVRTRVALMLFTSTSGTCEGSAAPTHLASVKWSARIEGC
ncbi:hypothetical protein HPB50_013500 [Hyalomma asiaticum]|uniref:Uncharacterized protein n=1 Tax=Hyalomma asiaticum TaxID=266040 RepID=A0ACB7SE40_HYAAI|nr:hypothetical protein HPB50_013500 [Hyalomma asiaticum]